ncbi:hypothetical protein [Sulfitobacter alexandrii]|uniref:hypothetical protein n=1 Tax=Sulfitobacter alexandrii TaxID=1917485 RepID=UPI0012EBB159|nr:hypothetical protein [Sulfitobacter alexandrii]
MLSEDQQALFGLVNYAASELNALQRVYIGLSHSVVSEPWLDATILIQRNSILRVWSAKIFEFFDCIEQLVNKKGLDAVVRNLVDEAERELVQLRADDGYALVRNVRHEATNHFSFKAAKKNLPYLADHADCNLYLHELDGNSYYPMGEELMFIARLNRHGANLSSKEEKAKALDDWMEWNFKANAWVRKFHLAVFKRVLDGQVPDRFARETWKWVDPVLVADTSPPTAPLFLRKTAPCSA